MEIYLCLLPLIVLSWSSRRENKHANELITEQLNVLRAQTEAFEAQAQSDYHDALYRLDIGLIDHPEFFRLISSKRKSTKERAFAFYIMNLIYYTHDMNKRRKMKDD